MRCHEQRLSSVQTAFEQRSRAAFVQRSSSVPAAFVHRSNNNHVAFEQCSCRDQTAFVQRSYSVRATGVRCYTDAVSYANGPKIGPDG